MTVEDSRSRAIPIDGYVEAGCEIAPENTWPEAPREAIIFGLKELPEDGTPLPHRHIMFGHAFKGQHGGRRLLERFRAGGGTLYDLEYLVDEAGRRVAAFGYWAGYAGAAVSLMAWAAQAQGGICPPWAPIRARGASGRARRAARYRRGDAPFGHRDRRAGPGGHRRRGSVRGDGRERDPLGHGRDGRGGPFPEILDHDIFLNCIFARPGTPVFVPRSALDQPRRLTVIGDVACDPDSDYNPVPVYDSATTWAAPVLRVHEVPPMDVMAIDNLPSLLPVESSQDYAAQLLPSLLTLDRLDRGVWARAEATFETHMTEV